MNRQRVFPLLVLAVIALGEGAPTTSNNPTPDAAPTTATNAPITGTKISTLKVSALQETNAVLTEIYELEKHTVRY